jgi:hypothetical protein
VTRSGASPAGRTALASLAALALLACGRDGGGSTRGPAGGGSPPPTPPRRGVSVTFTQIWIGYAAPGGLPRVTRSKAEARALAEILARRVRAGEAMEPLVREHTDDRDPEGKPFNDGSYSKTWDQIPHPDLRRAVFSLKPGEAAEEPVDSGVGFHVIRRDG